MSGVHYKVSITDFTNRFFNKNGEEIMTLVKKGLLTLLIAFIAVNAQKVISDYTFKDVTGKSHHFYGYLDANKWLALFLTKPGD